ncbi:MAG: ABC transporter permease [Acidobacteria bacterium]|nr:ABC transporter permease [Acidobacteriota bacterium]
MRSERLYRALLRLYPARFREEYERELLRSFREERAEGAPAVKFWLRILGDLAATVPARLMEEAAQDLRHSVRVHARRPFVALFAIAALALGIGVATGLFGVLDTMLWRRLPYAEPDRLVFLHMLPGSMRLTESPTALHDWARQSPYLKDAAIFASDELNVAGGPRTVRVNVCETSANLFALMGTSMAWGRRFLPEEETRGRNDTAVISHAMWDQEFGGDPRVLGRTIRISGTPFRIVGVAPAGFDYPAGSQVWTPTVFEFERIPKEGVIFWQVMGRLKDGVPLEQAQALYLAEASRLNPRRMQEDEANRPALQTLKVQLAGASRKPSLVLFGAVLCVLLIACGNVANLLLTRVLDRRRELQIRAALGASRARLFQQLLFESLALALVAGAAGILLAQGVVRIAASLQPGQPEAQVDWRMLAFAVGLSLLTGLVFGVLPAWHVSRLQTSNEALRAGSARVPAARIRTALTALQVVLTIVLLAGGVSLGRTFLAMMRVDAGYQTAGVATLRVSLTGTSREDGARRMAYYREALDRLRVLPGVESAGAVNRLPLSTQPIGMGRWVLDNGQKLDAAMSAVAMERYFAALSTPVVAGRDFRETDNAAAEAIAVVNETMARSLGGPQASLGQRIRSSGNSQPRRIVGVVKASLHFGPGSEPMPQVFVPLGQSDATTLTFVLKTRGKLAPVMASARAALAGVDPNVPVFAVQSMDSYLAERTAKPRMYTGTLVFFGLFAAFLAVLGLYATVSYSVSQRTQEMGVRLALGGTPGLLCGLILRQSMPVVLGALAAGTAVVLALGRLLSALLYQAKEVTWQDCSAAGLGLALIAGLAILMAARRVSRLNPALVLRPE